MRILGVRLLISAAAGVVAILAATVIAAITGSEPISPVAAVLIGAAVGISAGAAVGGPQARGSRLAHAALQGLVAGFVAALTIFLLRR